MNTKENLTQAFRLDQRISSNLEQVGHLRGLLHRATASLYSRQMGESQAYSPRENVVI
jgi:hypothetical protein